MNILQALSILCYVLGGGLLLAAAALAVAHLVSGASGRVPARGGEQPPELRIIDQIEFVHTDRYITL